MTAGRPWLDAAFAAGAVPAAFVPDASGGRSDVTEVAGADVVEGATLAAVPLGAPSWTPAPVTFVDGIQRWVVVGYDGVVPLIHAYVAAAARRRGPDRRLRTVAENSRMAVITSVRELRPAVRRALEAGAETLIDLDDVEPGQPGRALTAAGIRVERLREGVEREVAEPLAPRLGAEEWLVIDGVLSDSTALATHPRAVGVIKSHGAQYFTGDELTRALTIPAGHRTSVFQPKRHGRQPVHSWYLRLWPWQGHDLLYGLLRIEVRAHADSIRRADAVGAWLIAERAPLSTPDARFDRLLYPIHDVETYLRSRAPGDLTGSRGSRLPKTGT